MNDIEEVIEDLKELLNEYWESRYYEPIRLAISALEHQLTNEAEIKRLQDENESLRNWNICEKEQYTNLLESDKRRIEMEEENEVLRQCSAEPTASEFLSKAKAICKKFEDVDGYKLCDICPALHLCGGIENIADEAKLIQAVMDYK